MTERTERTSSGLFAPLRIAAVCGVGGDFGIVDSEGKPLALSCFGDIHLT
ncbi:hypothetical protein [Chlorobaculum limnaeum]|nr:hypothetical protein [Chlorobaculum limnaeum]